VRLKLDENVPQDIVPDVARLGHDVDTVLQEGLRGHPDADVWQAAQAEGRFLITQDLDFADTLAYPPGGHAGVLVLRLGDASRRRIAARLLDVLTTGDVESWSGCLVIASRAKLRVRRPEDP